MEELARELFPGVRLTTIRTDRFHSGYFSVHLLRPLRREDASQGALLMNVLHRGTRTLPDMVRLSEALETLYGSALEPGLRQVGEVTAAGLTAVFPDDRYLPGGEDCLGKIVAIAGEMLLDPATRGGLLRDDYVRSERQNLHDRVAAGINNKRSYALKRARQIMFAGEAYGVYPLGEAEDALHVHYRALTSFYREALSSSPVELCYCGSAEHARVEEAVRRAFMTLPGGGERPWPETALVPGGELQRVTETVDAEQGQLVLGFRWRRSGPADYPALAVFNELFGGGTGSRLFRNVREKRSLCYQIGSSVERYKEIMFVSAGIDVHRQEETEKAILSELRALAGGAISPEELETARESVKTEYLQGLDSPGTLCAFRLGQNLLGTGGDLRQFAALAEEVTAQDVGRIASEMQPELVYFLRGEERA